MPRLTLPLALACLLALAPAGLDAHPLVSAARHRGTPPGCALFPPTNVWNKPVDQLPVESDSATIVRSIGASIGLHPDFSSIAGGDYGIPYNVVTSSQAKVRVRFTYASESDKGPYPIPAHPLIENGSDRHMLIVDRDACRLYELWDAKLRKGGWHAGSGAIWHLGSNALRPDGWTSADAAGLPILSGLARYDEVAAGQIDHALRFTVSRTRAAHIYPARHDASSSSDPSLPPMGLRLRLKASVNISTLPPQARVIAQALKTYGMIVADNGSSWYVSGAPDAGWNDDDLHQLDRLHGSDFEVVDTSHLRNG
jgi:hypothetical protein